VRAPDGEIAGLIWETGSPEYFRVATQPDRGRWGTFAVQLDLPMTANSEAEAFLRALLPKLIPYWRAHGWSPSSPALVMCAHFAVAHVRYGAIGIMRGDKDYIAFRARHNS
jgi:hypothetical protein